MTGRGNDFYSIPGIHLNNGQTAETPRAAAIATHCHPLPPKKTKQGQGVVIKNPYK
jgi:hypothetical protein